MKLRRMGSGAGIVLMLALLAPHANADVVSVGYTVTGSTDDWTLDFTVTNNIPAAADQKVYFFGVDISPTDETGFPSGWTTYVDWNTSDGGEGIGDNITFPNGWITDLGAGIASGASLSGFEVLVTTATAPTDVAWFAYGFGGSYAGDWNYFDNAENPGFQGGSSITSTTPTIPEPSTFVLALTGLGLSGLIRKRIVSALR